MSKMFADVQPAVRKETKKVAIGTFVCVVLMWAVFGIGHLAVPEQIPFDYTVLLAGFIGGMVAVLNFSLMGLTVQKIVSMEDDKQAAAKMKASYSQRMMLQLIWGVLAIAVPCFQFVAGILPLLFSKHCDQDSWNHWGEEGRIMIYTILCNYSAGTAPRSV